MVFRYKQIGTIDRHGPIIYMTKKKSEKKKTLTYQKSKIQNLTLLNFDFESRIKI